jgi:hypothetical protein
MRQVASIPTWYRGVKYRSKLEARWALFFDFIDEPFEYESEGFDIDGEWYLPDFWLPSVRAWIEIKGVRQGHASHCEKLFRVCEHTKTFGVVFVGSPKHMLGSFVGCDSTSSHGGTYQDFFNCKIIRGDKKHAVQFGIEDRRPDRVFFTADFSESLDDVWRVDSLSEFFLEEIEKSRLQHAMEESVRHRFEQGQK